MKYFTLNEYIQLPEEDEAYLIDGFLPRNGRIMLMGPAKEGKSFLAIQIGLAIAKGEPFMGRHSSRGRVLYLQYDTPHKLWLKRMRKLHKAGVTFHDEFLVLDPSDFEYRRKIDVFGNPEDVDYLKNVVDQLQPDVVIIDTLRKLYNGDENSSAVGKVVFDTLNDVFQNQAVIYIHHSHKLSPPPGQKIQTPIAPRDAQRGTSYFADEVDAVFMLLGKRLRSNCRFDEDIDVTLDKDPITHLWTFPDLDKLSKMEENIKNFWKSKKWESWAVFRKAVSHTFIEVPDHLMSRLETELQGET